MRKNSWRAVLILLFAGVVAFVLSFVLQFPVTILAGLRPSVATRMLEAIMGQLAQVVAVPFASIALTLLYYDSRIRQEAFDLEMMAKNLGVPSAPADPQARPAGEHRPFGAFKTCPKCGAQVPNIQPACGKCGTRVPFGQATR
jgi:hypothetical protein